MGDALGHLVVPPHFRPTDVKLWLDLEGRQDGGFLVRVLKGPGKRGASDTTIEVRPDGVTVLVPSTWRDGRRDWPVERIVEVRAARNAGVCLTAREPVGDGSARERWVRVWLPLFGVSQKQQKQHGPEIRLKTLASSWLAAEMGGVLRRPKLPDEYVVGPGWVDASVEDAGRHGQLVYGVSAPVEHADRPPAVEAGPVSRLDVPPRPIVWRGMVVMAVVLGILWLFGVGLCAGVIGRAAVVPGEIFGVILVGLALFTMVGSIVNARQHVTITTPEPGVVDVDVRRFPRRRRRRLTRDNTRAVYLADGRRTPSLLVSRDRGKDKVLLSGLDQAVVRSAEALIERHLQLEPADPTTTAAAAGPPTMVAKPAVPVAPVGPPTGPCPEAWTVQEGGEGTWVVTRPAAGVGEKVRTAGWAVGVIAAAAYAAVVVPGWGPVPGVGGVIVSGIGFLVLAGRIERALGPATVRFDGAAVHTARRGMFGWARKSVEAWSIERVRIENVSAGEEKRPTASVQLRLRNGIRHSAIGVVPEPGARWLAQKLANSLNMSEEAGDVGVADELSV